MSVLGHDADFSDLSRVLHSASFTPFLVIFLHAIAATSTTDLSLLEEVVETLRRVRTTSQASERLYTVCATFARLARGLIEARGGGVGMYNEQEDHLRIDGAFGQGVFAFGLEGAAGSFGVSEFEDQLDGIDAGELSALLGEWVDGQASVMRILEGNCWE